MKVKTILLCRALIRRRVVCAEIPTAYCDAIAHTALLSKTVFIIQSVFYSESDSENTTNAIGRVHW